MSFAFSGVVHETSCKLSQFWVVVTLALLYSKQEITWCLGPEARNKLHYMILVATKIQCSGTLTGSDCYILFLTARILLYVEIALRTRTTYVKFLPTTVVSEARLQPGELGNFIYVVLPLSTDSIPLLDEITFDHYNIY